MIDNCVGCAVSFLERVAEVRRRGRCGVDVRPVWHLADWGALVQDGVDHAGWLSAVVMYVEVYVAVDIGILRKRR